MLRAPFAQTAKRLGLSPAAVQKLVVESMGEEEMGVLTTRDWLVFMDQPGVGELRAGLPPAGKRMLGALETAIDHSLGL
jgi:hypothetical protein